MPLLYQDFFTLIETQFAKVIKRFRSNNAHDLQFRVFFLLLEVMLFINTLVLIDLNKTLWWREDINTFSM